MPLHANPLAVNNTPVQLEQGFNNVTQGVANMPALYAQAALSQAHGNYLNAETQKVLSEIGIQNALKEAQTKLYGAQTQNATAEAQHNLGLANQVAAQNDAFKNLLPQLMATGMSPQKAALTAGLMVAGKGNANELSQSIGSTVGTIDQMNLPQNASEAQARQPILLRDPKAIFNNTTAITPAFQIQNENNKPIVANNRVINPGMVPQLSAMNNPSLVQAAYGSGVSAPQPTGSAAPAPATQIVTPSTSPTAIPFSQGGMGAAPAAAPAPAVAPVSAPGVSPNPSPLASAVSGANVQDATATPGMLTLPWKNTQPITGQQNPYLPTTTVDPILERKAFNDFLNPKALGATQANVQNLQRLQDLIAHRVPDQSGDVHQGGVMGSVTSIPLVRNMFASPADQEFDKTVANLQLGGGGLGNLLSGSASTGSDYRTQTAGQGTPSRYNQPEANASIIQHALDSNNQATEAKDFIGQYIDHGGSLQQGIMIAQKYLTDPNVYPLTKDPTTGQMVRSSKYTPIGDYYKNLVGSWKPGDDAFSSAAPSSGASAAVPSVPASGSGASSLAGAMSGQSSVPQMPAMVKVLHPDGTPGSIPATQVQDALSQGYKLNQ
jgi:hypothetical protein